MLIFSHPGGQQIQLWPLLQRHQLHTEKSTMTLMGCNLVSSCSSTLEGNVFWYKSRFLCMPLIARGICNFWACRAHFANKILLMAEVTNQCGQNQVELGFNSFRSFNGTQIVDSSFYVTRSFQPFVVMQGFRLPFFPAVKPSSLQTALPSTMVCYLFHQEKFTAFMVDLRVHVLVKYVGSIHID